MLCLYDEHCLAYWLMMTFLYEHNAGDLHTQAVHKVMNNYLGIGVDAKVSLEFHTFREQFPDWFRSQIGNKVCASRLFSDEWHADDDDGDDDDDDDA